VPKQRLLCGAEYLQYADGIVKHKSGSGTPLHPTSLAVVVEPATEVASVTIVETVADVADVEHLPH
jgi:hypothetical protein